jgi:hypothetical protein
MPVMAIRAILALATLGGALQILIISICVAWPKEAGEVLQSVICNCHWCFDKKNLANVNKTLSFSLPKEVEWNRAF